VFLGAVITFTSARCCARWRRRCPLVVAARGAGHGRAMLLPVGRLAVLRSVPREQFLRAMSFIAIPALVGPLLGPTLGGWLVRVASWHWIFLINLPIGALALLAALRIMPDHRASDHPLRPARLHLLAFGMVLLSLALDGAADHAAGHALVLLLGVFGLAALAGYWLHALQVPQPLFPPDLFRIAATASADRQPVLAHRQRRDAVLIPLLLQVGLGLAAMRAGMMIPVALAGMASRSARPWHWSIAGATAGLMVNTVLVGVMMASFALIGAGQPLGCASCSSLLRRGQLAAVHGDEHGDPARPGRRVASAGNSLLSMVMMLATGRRGRRQPAGRLQRAPDPARRDRRHARHLRLHGRGDAGLDADLLAAGRAAANTPGGHARGVMAARRAAPRTASTRAPQRHPQAWAGFGSGCRHAVFHADLALPRLHLRIDPLGRHAGRVGQPAGLQRSHHLQQPCRFVGGVARFHPVGKGHGGDAAFDGAVHQGARRPRIRRGLATTGSRPQQAPVLMISTCRSKASKGNRLLAQRGGGCIRLRCGVAQLDEIHVADEQAELGQAPALASCFARTATRQALSCCPHRRAAAQALRRADPDLVVVSCRPAMPASSRAVPSMAARSASGGSLPAGQKYTSSQRCGRSGSRYRTDTP
jgi:MFS family permease